MSLKGLFFMCFCILLVQNIFVEVTNQPFCFKVPPKKDNTYKLYYHSMEQISQASVEVKGDNFATIKLAGQQNKTEFSAEQESEVCLKGNKELEHISIDIYPTEISHYKEAAHKSQFYEVHEELIMVGETLKELARNEEFQEEKEFYHENNLAKNSKIVRIYGIVKCLSVAAVVVGQLYLLKKYMSPDF